MSAWLTQIILNTRDRQVRNDLRDSIGMHRRIMRLIPDNYGESPRHAAGVLYRIEEDYYQPQLLVQTAVEPNLTRLPPDTGQARTKNLAGLLESLRPHATVHYRLIANTSKRLYIKPENRIKKNAPAIALWGVAAEQWWTDRAGRCGLRLQTVQMNSADYLQGRNGDRLIKHAANRFDGTAVVTDPAALRTAILTGIGRGKAYGCGLLSIVPVR